MNRRLSTVAVLSILLLAAWTEGATGSQPELVSPGEAQKPVSVADRCPTFSWGASAPTNEFELAVYRVPGEALPAMAETEELASPLRERVPSTGFRFL